MAASLRDLIVGCELVCMANAFALPSKNNLTRCARTHTVYFDLMPSIWNLISFHLFAVLHCSFSFSVLLMHAATMKFKQFIVTWNGEDNDSNIFLFFYQKSGLDDHFVPAHKKEIQIQYARKCFWNGREEKSKRTERKNVRERSTSGEEWERDRRRDESEWDQEKMNEKDRHQANEWDISKEWNQDDDKNVLSLLMCRFIIFACIRRIWFLVFVFYSFSRRFNFGHH